MARKKPPVKVKPPPVLIVQCEYCGEFHAPMVTNLQPGTWPHMNLHPYKFYRISKNHPTECLRKAPIQILKPADTKGDKYVCLLARDAGIDYEAGDTVKIRPRFIVEYTIPKKKVKKTKRSKK